MKRHYWFSLLLIISVILFSACTKQQVDRKTQQAIKKAAIHYIHGLWGDPEFCNSLDLTGCRFAGTKDNGWISSTTADAAPPVRVEGQPETYEVIVSTFVRGNTDAGDTATIIAKYTVTVARTGDEEDWQGAGYQLASVSPFNFPIRIGTWFILANCAWIFSVPLFFFLLGVMINEDEDNADFGCYGQISVLVGMVLGGTGAIYTSFMNPVLAFILGFIAYPVAMVVFAFLIAILIRFLRAIFRLVRKRGTAPF